MFGNLINEHPNPRDNEKELPKLLRSMARSTDEINSNVQEYIGNATPTIERVINFHNNNQYSNLL